MGVEYQHFAIPRDNSFRPTAEQLAGLINRLDVERWICSPTNPTFPKMTFEGMDYHPKARQSGYLVRNAAGFSSGLLPIDVHWLSELMRDDFMLFWPVCYYHEVAEGLTYPLTPELALDDEPYFDLKIHVSNDHVYRISEIIVPFKSTLCECGADLQYWPDVELKGESIFYSSRLRVACEKCHKSFSPAQLSAEYINGWTDARSRIKGGATSRFSLSIDCGKCFPQTETGDIALNSQLKALLEDELQTAFYEIGDIY